MRLSSNLAPSSTNCLERSAPQVFLEILDTDPIYSVVLARGSHTHSPLQGKQLHPGESSQAPVNRTEGEEGLKATDRSTN